MNCDDFLIAQETGGFFGRFLARRHAAKCPRCAALQTTFAAVKQELARPEPLSPRAGHLWKHAAQEPTTRHSPFRNWITIGGGLAAAACVLLLVMKFTGHKPDVSPSPRPEFVDSRHLTTPTVTTIDPAKELAQLSEATDRLDADLKKLRQDAQRMDARRQVAMTFEHFDKW